MRGQDEWLSPARVQKPAYKTASANKIFFQQLRPAPTALGGKIGYTLICVYWRHPQMQPSQIPQNFHTAGFFGASAVELIVIVIPIVFGIVLLPAIFYLLSLQRALEKCAPESRTIEPGKVWFLLIPIFNLVWNFVVVSNMSKSLRSELLRRGMPNVEPEPGQPVGLAMCILAFAGLIPVVGVLFSFAGFICWIIYWVKVSDYSRALSAPMPSAISV